MLNLSHQTRAPQLMPGLPFQHRMMNVSNKIQLVLLSHIVSMRSRLTWSLYSTMLFGLSKRHSMSSMPLLRNFKKDGYCPQLICPPSLPHLDLTFLGLQHHKYLKSGNTYPLQHHLSSSHLLNIHTDGV